MIKTSDELRWYVAHTYAEYEMKVKDSIEKTVDNRNIRNLIAEVRVPTEDVVEEKEDGRKIYPGYIFVKMIMTNETWYIVRNTRGCTGFVGPGSEPVPLSEKEVERMGVEVPAVEVDYAVGDTVRINEGSMEGFMGEVVDINTERRTVSVMVTMFGGREMQVDFDFRQVEPLD